MKLKLSYAEFAVLLQLLQRFSGATPKDLQGILVHAVIFRLYGKFHRKSILSKPKYTISMDNDEAAAFAMLFSMVDLAGYEIFTVNLVHQITNAIKQKFAC